MWSIWLARNETIFQNSLTCPYIIFYRLEASSRQHMTLKPPKPPRVLLHKKILVSMVQESGFSLQTGTSSLSKLVWVRLETTTDLLAANPLLALASKFGIWNLDIFSDSKIIIEWLNGSMNTSSIQHQASVKEKTDKLTQFHSFSITHIFRELNFKADQ